MDTKHNTEFSAAWDNAWGQRDPEAAYKRGSQLLTRMARANGDPLPTTNELRRAS